ncbi:MAG: PfkB family carbohydrate kinase [Bacteroidia bacterium]|nr:PfkB family carbohydrate kinase [Bacteroidia bacterium]
MKIFTIGETTYDILFRDGSPVGACNGGSAYNSAISLGRCGLPVSLISTFGNDYIGKLSLAFLTKNGVSCNLIKRFDGQSRIALAFFDSDNNADYSFYQASMDIIPEYPVPQKNDIILLGSSFALRDNGRENLISFLQQANNAGCIIIYDPNARQSVAEKPEIVNKILQNIALATIIKGSDLDFRNIFGLNDGRSVYSLVTESGNKYLVYTKGSEGAELFTRDFHLVIAAKETKVISTIGAGDNFSAGIVYGIFNHMTDNSLFEELTPNKWEEIMNYGILFATEVCGSSGNYFPLDAAKRLLSGQI